MYYGKIYFYWGGPGFDTTPDFVLEGQYHGQYASPRNKSPIIDAGDMNGDGYDDIVVSELLSAGVGKTCVYYGRQVPQSMPDLEFSSPEDNSSLVYPLDDVNGDNLADVSLIAWNSNMDETVVYIWYGGDIQPTFFRSWGYGLLYGLGDVNGDGYGDCLEYYPVNSLMFYYGGEDFPADSLLILEPQINGYPYSPVGDCNGDGFADFMARDKKIWLGRPNLTNIPDFQLSFTGSELYSTYNTCGFPLVSGDFNGDGYDDFVGADNTVNLFDGQVVLWMGRGHINGSIDLVLNRPQISRSFGYDKASADLNADGLDDLIVSAPFWWDGDEAWTEPGKVYVYAGNPLLADTGVANDDPVQDSPELTQTTLSVYPNPLPGSTARLTARLTTSSEIKPEELSFELYDLRGRRLAVLSKSSTGMREGEYSIEIGKQAPGLYLLAAYQGDQRLAVTKLLVY